MDGHLQPAVFSSQSGAELAVPEALPAPTMAAAPPSSRRKSPPGRKWNVPPGGIITNGAGYLRRQRPDTYHHVWSSVPVGRVASQKLSKGLNERDYLILLMAERSQVVTTEQIARIFFDSLVTARKRIRLLRERRFLATPEVDHRMLSAAVGHRGGTHNAPLVLDWNGKYLLEDLKYELSTWHPSTVARASSRFGHTLGVSELWSYVVAAARATHERVAQVVGVADEQAKVRDELAVGLLNESASVVYYEGCTGWSLELGRAETQSSGTETAVQLTKERTTRWKYRPLVKPDATLVLSVTSDEPERAYREAARNSNSKSSRSYQGSWHSSLLPCVPSPATMRSAERLGRTRYRYVFLEMETGSNSSKDLVQKIGRYNELCNRLTQGDMMHGQSWRTLFGTTLPMILVAVRDSSQVEGQVTLWRTHYAAKSPGTVLLANLEVLALVYARGRSSLLTQPCWLDIMRPEGPKWRSLSEILGLRI